MCDSPAFAEYGGLGIIQPYFFDFYNKDEDQEVLAVDPGLSNSPYTSSQNSSTPSPEPLMLSSPPSCHEYFFDHRDSIGSLDSATIAPHETVTNTVAAKNNNHGSSSHNNNNNINNNNNNNNNTKNNGNRASRTTPSSASASMAASTPASTPAAAPLPPTNTSPMVTRTRKASSQNTDASAQPRAKKQKTAAPAQPITVKTEPVEPQQQRPQQRQRQSSPPPKRKAARRGSAAKKEDVAQRTKNLERNRIAASKCRQKKKEWVVELEETKTKMELHHNKLRIEYLELLGEVTSIKNQLMAHANCVDPNINFWIEKEALKYVERCAMDPAQERRPSVVGNAASGSGTLPSPAESHRSQQESPLAKPEGGINLDYMPDELLAGDF